MKTETLANFFAAFSDETRLKILIYLLEGEKNVGDISTNCELTVSNTSHQLRYLKEQRLVKTRRDGKYMFYSLDDDHVKIIIEYGRDHINE